MPPRMAALRERGTARARRIEMARGREQTTHQSSGRSPGRSPGRGGTVLLALAAGVAGGMLAPLLFPNAGRAGVRPAAKSAVKAALTLYERGREVAAEFGETASDILAEAQAEFAEERRARSARPDPETAHDVVALRMAAAEPRNA
jgi:hypothetical protein